MIRGVHHVAIATPNLDRLRDFYCRLMGFSEINESAWPRGIRAINEVLGLSDSAARQAMLRHDNLCLELFEFAYPHTEAATAERPVCNPGHTHICFDVRDIDSVYARLVAAGTHFHCAPKDFGSIKATYGRDPDGNVFELQELMDPADPAQIIAS